ncbi:MAG: hypothetical protein CR967_00320 [Proteobacteria bacterium]|nr:MAG: hypothetical protein CR967_00320 [Pseudomonadota bacterium]
MINKKTLSSLAILGFMINGCVNSFSNQMNVQNENLEKQYMPIRLYKTTSTNNADIYESDWAGEKGKSIALNSKLLYSDVLKAFKQGCGFEESDLVETRIVSHKIPVFYEVWVFKDAMSKRKDKTSGLSVVLTQLPNGGGVDIYFYGKCHSEPMRFVFTK